MLMVTAEFSWPRSAAVEQECRELLRQGQSQSGGWGPFVLSPPEVYDTALALIGLAASRDPTRGRVLLSRGREFLIAQQQADGSWIETTRPSGGESYAQRISTCGWAAMALLATRPISVPAVTDPKRSGHGLGSEPIRDGAGHVNLERSANGIARRVFEVGADD
jgi:hypothetical protein